MAIIKTNITIAKRIRILNKIDHDIQVYLSDEEDFIDWWNNEVSKNKRILLKHAKNEKLFTDTMNRLLMEIRKVANKNDIELDF